MSDDYLWDGGGPPDPEIARLERALAPLRPSRPAPEVAVRPVVRQRWPWLVGAASVACVAAAAALVLVRLPRRETAVAPPAPVTVTAPVLGWEVTVTEGQPGDVRIEGRALTAATRLAPGQVLETAAHAKVRLAVPAIGAVDVDPRTRLGLVATGKGAQKTAHRIRLEVGSIHALIWSPPGTFFVDTPAGTAVDLGCAYSVTVDDGGDGLLRVHSGWVGFERASRESFVPAGAECALRRSSGPGTPVRSDASAAFRAALARLDVPAGDQVSAGDETRAPALRHLLAAARPQDGVTLWHLLGRASRAERALLLRRLVALQPEARAADRRQVIAGDPRALDALWDHLGLGSMAIWRSWKAQGAGGR